MKETPHCPAKKRLHSRSDIVRTYPHEYDFNPQGGGMKYRKGPQFLEYPIYLCPMENSVGCLLYHKSPPLYPILTRLLPL